MPIYLPEDQRSKALAQFGASLGQSAGQALSAKTLKSMFQDVIDSGGSPLTAMQRIMPYDPELADELGDKYSQQEGDKYLRDLVRKELGIDVPDNVSGALAIGGAKIHMDEQARQAAAQEAKTKAANEAARLALEERRVAVAERPGEPTQPKTTIENVGGKLKLINMEDGSVIKTLGVEPPKSGGSGADRTKDLLDEWQANRKMMASVQSGADIYLPDDQTKGEAIRMLEKRNEEIKRQYKKLGGDMGDLGEFSGAVIEELTTALPPAEYKGRIKMDPDTGIKYISDGEVWKVHAK